MKKIIGILLLICICFSLAGCGTFETTVKPEEKFPFYLPEWVEWGMKEGEVRQQINNEIYEDGDMIYYIIEEPYRNCDVKVYFGFSKENELIYMSFNFYDNDVLSNGKNQYNDIYLECKKKFLDLYGTPIVDEETWKDEHYKNDEYMLYKAIDEGHYHVTTQWGADNYYCSIDIHKELCITFSTCKDMVELIEKLR